MPTYVYECSTCKKVFEADQRITEDPLKDCDCGGKGSLKRLIQPIAVMFKGSGFHINDYAAKTPTAETVAETAAAEPATPADVATPTSAEKAEASTPSTETAASAPATPAPAPKSE